MRDCGDSQLGEIITPEAVVGVTNDAMVGTKVEETYRRQTATDPAAGTGRFLVDLAVRYPNRKIALIGVERNLDLYRACLVNMRLHAWNRPYFALCADSMLVDVQPNSPA